MQNTTTMKHIKMPREMAAKWLEALRSGKYQKAKEALEARLIQSDPNGCRLPESKGYCCLGVLQMEAVGGVEKRSSDGHPRGYPTIEWLGRNGIEFRHLGGDEPSVQPHLPNLGMLAGDYNDHSPDTQEEFNKIADAIEATLETY